MLTLRLVDGSEEQINNEKWPDLVEILTKKSLTGSVGFLDSAKFVTESGRIVTFGEILSIR